MAAGLLDVRDGQDGQIVLPDDITLRVGAENLNQEYRFIHAFNIPLHLFVLQQKILTQLLSRPTSTFRKERLLCPARWPSSAA